MKVAKCDYFHSVAYNLMTDNAQHTVYNFSLYAQQFKYVTCKIVTNCVPNHPVYFIKFINNTPYLYVMCQRAISSNTQVTK